MKQTYQDKLRDPRWQDRRTEILRRDNYTCQCCGDTAMLQVHHRVYWTHQNPWEYGDDFLVTLCAECHQNEERLIKRPKYGLDAFMQAGFLAQQLNSFFASVSLMKLQASPENVINAYAHAFEDPDMQALILQKYKEHQADLEQGGRHGETGA